MRRHDDDGGGLRPPPSIAFGGLLTAQIDACLLGAGMYPGHELYRTAIENEADKPHAQTGKLPTPGEVEWARFAAQTPHYVLANALTSARWSRTSFVRTVDDVAALKQQPDKDIYLVGGGRTAAILIEAGLVDELRLIVYPLIAGEGMPLLPRRKLAAGFNCRRSSSARKGS